MADAASRTRWIATFSLTCLAGVCTTDPTGASPDCTRLPPATQITAGDGSVWTVLPAIGGLAGQIGVARSGVRVSQAVDFVTIKGGGICQRDEGIWECWTGAAPPVGKWVSGAAPAGC